MIVQILVFLVVAVGGGLAATWHLVESGSALTTQTFGPWSSWITAGRMDADPYTRAHFVRHPILPISTALATRYQASEDDDGRALHSSCEYDIDGPEPTGAWWSLAAFDEAGRLIRNDAERHAFNADTAMRAPGGGLSIRLARNARPGNWLPTGGAGRLTLVLTVETPQGTADTGPPPQLPRIRRVAC